MNPAPLAGDEKRARLLALSITQGEHERRIERLERKRWRVPEGERAAIDDKIASERAAVEAIKAEQAELRAPRFAALTGAEKNLLRRLIAGDKGRAKLALGTHGANWPHSKARAGLEDKGAIEYRGALLYPGPNFEQARREL